MKQKTWVESGGGPLVVIPVEVAHHWRGVEGFGLINSDSFMLSEIFINYTDYDRACKVDDYLGMLEVGPGTCLVFGDEPLATTFLMAEEGAIFVRWVCAENEKDILQAAQVVPDDAWVSCANRFHVGKGGLLLFDSAFPGDDLPDSHLEEIRSWIHVPVPSGTYEVEPDDSTRLIVHRLRRVRK